MRRLDIQLKHFLRMQVCLLIGVVDSVYKKILDYDGPTTSNDDESAAHAKFKASNFGYHNRVDICRFFVAAYSHLNDYMYKTDRKKRAEIEETLSGYFPKFYVIMFECLCRNAETLEDKALKMISHLADVSDFPRL
ncbi:hypothetical protein QL285_078767 [Trifolium repens]|nr:hypothetical protein QL285_078767 [Trifolium repens]